MVCLSRHKWEFERVPHSSSDGWPAPRVGVGYLTVDPAGRVVGSAEVQRRGEPDKEDNQVIEVRSVQIIHSAQRVRLIVHVNRYIAVGRKINQSFPENKPGETTMTFTLSASNLPATTNRQKRAIRSKFRPFLKGVCRC